MYAVETLLLDIRSAAGQRLADEARLLIARMAGVVLYQADDAWPRGDLRWVAAPDINHEFWLGAWRTEAEARDAVLAYGWQIMQNTACKSPGSLQ